MIIRRDGLLLCMEPEFEHVLSGRLAGNWSHDSSRLVL